MALPKFEQAIVGILGVLTATSLVMSSGAKLNLKYFQQVVTEVKAESRPTVKPQAIPAPTPNYAYRQVEVSLIFPVATEVPISASGGVVLHSLAKPNGRGFGVVATVVATPGPLPLLAVVSDKPESPRGNLDLGLSPANVSRNLARPNPDIPNEIVISAINLIAPIQVVGVVKNKSGVATWATAKGRAAAWHNDSARLGERGNVVLNGHNNIEGKVFERLQDLKVGQKVVLRSATREITYILYDKELVLERGQSAAVLMEHAKYLLQTPDDRLTLVTCWPNWDNSHRLLWFGRPVEEKLREN